MGNRGTFRARATRWGFGGATGALAVCLVIVNPAAASGPISYTHPWKQATVVPYANYLTRNGCVELSGRSVTFAKATGYALWKADGAARSCGRALGSSSYSEALDESLVAVTVPVRVPVGTNAVSINVTWNLVASANETYAVTGACPAAVYNASLGYGESYCAIESIAETYLFVELIDVTTGAVSYPSTFPTGAYAYALYSNGTYCSSASSCTTTVTTVGTPSQSDHVSGPVVLTVNATTTSKDRYAVFTYVGGEVLQYITGFRGRTTGAVDMRTAGDHARLASITVA